MSVFAPRAPQISARRVPRSADRNFMPENAPTIFVLCRRRRPARNDMSAPTGVVSRYNVCRGDQIGAGTTLRNAGDSRGRVFVHCIHAPAQAQADALGGDDRARQGADDRGRLRELPYRRSGKAVRRRQAHRYPLRRNLFGQPDAGPRNRTRRPGATPISTRALRYGVDPDGSRYYPAFPYPNFTKLTRDDILAIRAYLATLTPVRNTRRRRNCAGR